MSPVARPAQPPQPPEHPSLGVACDVLDRALDAIEQQRQDDANEAVAMAVTLGTLASAGIADCASLPPAIRRLSEGLTIAALRSTKGMHPDARTALVRSVWLAMRKIAEAYETEETANG